MIALEEVKQQFPELTDVTALGLSGGQKEVLRAKLNGCVVALKLIRVSPQDEERTEREIKAVTVLNSDYVARVFDSGKRMIGGQERRFIIEQFIHGTNYRAVLKAQPVQPLNSVLRLGSILLRACVDFEKAALVHRDIKPENLMVDADGKIWVIDFGLVRFLNMESLTLTAQRFGPCTLGYAAPEQFRNQKKQVNIRADLFSVGVVLYESLHGSNPYYDGKRDHLGVIRHVEGQDLLPLTIAGDTDGRLSEFLTVMTARFPSRRPPSAQEALDWYTPICEALMKP